MTSDDYPQQWLDLARHAREESDLSLRDRFRLSPGRSREFTFSCGDLLVDFSRQHLSTDTLNSLVNLADACTVGEDIEDMFNGAIMNVTENRAAGHVLLRSDGDSPLAIVAREQRRRAAALADDVRSGKKCGATGARFTDVVSIGIGGSDLGNVMMHDALAHHADGPSVHFVSNIDPAHFDDVVFGRHLDPRTTMFVVSSKSFTTAETMHLASRARAFLESALGDAWQAHMVATTAAPRTALQWGIVDQHVLEFWDWVGGRFSASSVIGFPVMVAVGSDVFEQVLGGMRTIDEHFRRSPLETNVPALHAMVAVWNFSLKHHSSWSIVPYSHALRRFPAYLQQLVMESNGKSVKANGHAVNDPTSPVVWGEPGTNAQHSFFQLLHQGTSRVAVDFIGFVSGQSADTDGQRELVANLIAQASALAFGRSAQEARADGIDERLVPHRVFDGNRPSTVLLAPELTPSVLGQLMAFYEHSTVVQGWIWGINSFDQWGVELGKHLASHVGTSLATGDLGGLDSSARALVEWVLRTR